MPDSPVEKQSPPDYPQEMETRVAILEHSTAELKFEIREVKAMVRDLTNTVLTKFDATDKAISDLRVEVQSVQTELQSGLNSNLRWTITTILGFGAIGIAIIGLLIKFH